LREQYGVPEAPANPAEVAHRACRAAPYEGSEIPANLHEHWLFSSGRSTRPMPTALDNGRRSPKKLLRTVVARCSAKANRISRTAFPAASPSRELSRAQARPVDVFVIEGQAKTALFLFLGFRRSLTVPPLPFRVRVHLRGRGSRARRTVLLARWQLHDAAGLGCSSPWMRNADTMSLTPRMSANAATQATKRTALRP
jgi:hypothetical protein